MVISLNQETFFKSFAPTRNNFYGGGNSDAYRDCIADTTIIVMPRAINKLKIFCFRFGTLGILSLGSVMDMRN